MLSIYGTAGEAGKVLTIQFTVIQARTQMVLTLATIILSVLGFSGPRIAGSGLFAREAMIIGLLCVLGGVVTALISSLRIYWLTQFLETDAVERLSAMISYRNRKTRLFVLELAMVVCGLSCFVAALIAYLLSGSHALLSAPLGS